MVLEDGFWKDDTKVLIFPFFLLYVGMGKKFAINVTVTPPQSQDKSAGT
jgi:hypothetical protein